MVYDPLSRGNTFFCKEKNRKKSWKGFKLEAKKALSPWACRRLHGLTVESSEKAKKRSVIAFVPIILGMICDAAIHFSWEQFDCSISFVHTLLSEKLQGRVVGFYDNHDLPWYDKSLLIVVMKWHTLFSVKLFAFSWYTEFLLRCYCRRELSIEATHHKKNAVVWVIFLEGLR